jgi:hypothetical protein
MDSRRQTDCKILLFSPVAGQREAKSFLSRLPRAARPNSPFFLLSRCSGRGRRAGRESSRHANREKRAVEEKCCMEEGRLRSSALHPPSTFILRPESSSSLFTLTHAASTAKCRRPDAATLCSAPTRPRRRRPIAHQAPALADLHPRRGVRVLRRPCSSPAYLPRWISSLTHTAPPPTTTPTAPPPTTTLKAPQLAAGSTQASPPFHHRYQSGLGGGLPRTHHLLLSPTSAAAGRPRPRQRKVRLQEGAHPPGRVALHDTASSALLQSSLPVRTLDPLWQADIAKAG